MLKVSNCGVCKKLYRTGKLRIIILKDMECGLGVGRVRFIEEKIMACDGCYKKLLNGDGVYIVSDVVDEISDDGEQVCCDSMSRHSEQNGIHLDVKKREKIIKEVANRMSFENPEDIADDIGLTVEEVNKICAELGNDNA